MNFRDETCVRTILIVLMALGQSDARVSSLFPSAVLRPPEANLPTLSDRPIDVASDPGYFGGLTDNNQVNKCNTSKGEEPEIISALAGGEYAKIGQFPWMAVVHRLIGGGRVSMCGGSIISVRWILTAGHCVNEQPQQFFIVLGEIDKSGIGYDYYNGQGTSMMTSQGALHPQYGQSVNDIALLKMPRDIQFTPAIQPIRLAGPSMANQNLGGQTATIVGWGRDGPQSMGTKRLKYISIPILGDSQCQQTWQMADERNICTVSGTGRDACQGDSGGPLVINNGNEYVQVGVVSYGDGNCPSQRPGVFTRVSAFTDWIAQVTGIQYQ